ncbi:MAG: DUF192 domain-containing protein [Sulfobacillus acidophilus]|uniref:DUF192 domain-containing protein n=1 Tax=Sulfobacillus acidophilus TaxID=53633 RepID=A0A2T2WNW5_9FIRM|nr:MAG: DUF192 domain-containing protein [Sulfobacillus acidophilus]
MRHISVRVSGTDEVVGSKIRLAHNPWQRFLGLMGTRDLPSGSGMLFEKTNAVHGFFMRYAVRLVFLDSQGRVLVVTQLKPWHVGPIVRQARYVLELPENASTGMVHPGDQLIWEIQ